MHTGGAKMNKKLTPALLILVLLGIAQTTFAPLSCDAAAEQLKVEIVGADVTDKESEQVLSAFKKLMQGLGQKDLNAIGDCLSPEVILFHNHDLVAGKQAVLDHITKKVLGKDEGTVSSIVVYHPFIKVKGETAMVSFRATKEFTGAKPSKQESWCWEVFERKDNQWKVLQFHSNWAPLKASK